MVPFKTDIYGMIWHTTLRQEFSTYDSHQLRIAGGIVDWDTYVIRPAVRSSTIWGPQNVARPLSSRAMILLLCEHCKLVINVYVTLAMSQSARKIQWDRKRDRTCPLSPTRLVE